MCKYTLITHTVVDVLFPSLVYDMAVLSSDRDPLESIKLRPSLQFRKNSISIKSMYRLKNLPKINFVSPVKTKSTSVSP